MTTLGLRAPGTESGEVARAKGGDRLWFALALPLLAFLAIFFAYPMIDTLLRSLGAPKALGTFEHYAKAVDRPSYAILFRITFEIAFAVSILTVVVAYPFAYAMTVARRRTMQALMLCVLVPFFTSALVRTYAWMVILGPQGLLKPVMAWFGAVEMNLLYNRPAVLLGMAYTLLPYMVLTLYSVFRGIDRSLLQAAYNLGASDWQAFRRVFFPLSFPGVAGGFLLVFILALGYFITPSLMGGPRDQMIAMAIYEQIDLTFDWGFASALAVILLVATVLGFVLYDRIVGLRSLLESKTG